MSRYIVPLLIGLVGTGILLSLGTWQVKRLIWKEGELAKIEAQIHEDPAPLEAAIARGLVEFEPVEVSGSFVAQEAHVLNSIKRLGVVFRVVSPFVTEDGRRILVDRGYVLEAEKGAARPVTQATIIANYRTPQETDGFTPAPDWERNFVFARDVALLSAHFQTEPILLILRETSETNPPVTPWPVDTSAIPNDHLQYAITWFSLAAVWLGMTALLIARMRRP